MNFNDFHLIFKLLIFNLIFKFLKGLQNNQKLSGIVGEKSELFVNDVLVVNDNVLRFGLGR